MLHVQLNQFHLTEGFFDVQLNQFHLTEGFFDVKISSEFGSVFNQFEQIYEITKVAKNLFKGKGNEQRPLCI